MALMLFMYALPFILSAQCEEISLNGNGYIRYDIKDKLFNPNVNRINLKFRTSHPSGLLVFVTGVDGDSIALDIIQGTLRVTLKNKGVMLNEALVGKNLDNNKWHTINILRIKRLLDITLDGKSEKTILLQGYFTELYINWLLFVGGKSNEGFMNQIKSPEVEVKHFIGCLTSISIDNKRPLIELKKGNRNLRLFGMKRLPCRRDVFKPVHFASPLARLELIRIPESTRDREMKIKLQFRTFDTKGTFVFAQGKRCHFTLGHLGKKVYLELEQDEVLPARVEISDDVSRGLWHTVEATITQTEIFLKVDKSSTIRAALPKYTSGYLCSAPSRVLIGGDTSRKILGFVGCFNNIVVNGRVINAFDSKQTRLRGPVSAGCKIKDRCFPSPCRNDGRCFQTWHKYDCDCSSTIFYGKHCNIPIYKETCAAYASIGLKENSYCLLDSDSTGRLRPYTTLCNVTKNKEIVTVVSHDRARKLNISDGTNVIRGSHFHSINYELSMQQIEALISKSKSCRQLLRFDCYNAALLNSPDGPPNANWRTRSGEVKGYWGGVPDGGAGCKCGLTKSCEKKDRLCNCDSLNNKWAEDSGYISEKELLPVSRLHFSGITHGTAYITLGPLECFGTNDEVDQQEPLPNEILSKVCISNAAKKFMTANGTQLVWRTPVKTSEILKKIAEGKMKGNVIDFSPTEASRHSSESQSAGIGPRSTESPPVTHETIKLKNEVSHPAKITGNNSLSAHRNRNDGPSRSSERLSVERQLSILEIVLIIFAALAISVLLVKFVLMKTVDFFRRRYQIKRLHGDVNRNGTDSTQPLRGDQGEIVLKKMGPRKGGGAYWV